ncbi:MAG TPA: GNAT family N-acetyltransferase [Acidimicrobiales bacterium]|nr:GNAT family N-acetyltransferase [Acidimicrobiales bacterium]
MPAKPDPPAVAAHLVSAEAVIPVRAAVLRPGLPLETARFAGDDDARTLHAAVTGGDGLPVAVGTVIPAPAPWRVGPGPDWQIRGMATLAGHRGAGLGRAVLDLLVAEVAGSGGGVVWCNARMAAVPFYRRAGFEAVGDRFEIEGVGPHLVMTRTVPGS